MLVNGKEMNLESSVIVCSAGDCKCLFVLVQFRSHITDTFYGNDGLPFFNVGCAPLVCVVFESSDNELR